MDGGIVAEPAKKRSAQVTQHRAGVVASAVWLLISMVFWLFGSVIFSVLLELIGMHLWWPEQGAAHSRAMYEAELGYLNQDLRRSIVSSDAARFAEHCADQVHYWLVERTHLETHLTRLEQRLESSASPANPLQNKVFGGVSMLLNQAREHLMAAITTIQVTALRVAVLVLSFPVFVLAGLVGLTEGLVRRDLRRWGGGRESAFVYHQAKMLVFPLFISAWVLYLSLPFNLHPNLVILPCAAGFGAALMVSASAFKKYL